MIGINNAGKSSALRFFYEFRGLFNVLAGMSRDTVVAFLNEPSHTLAWQRASTVTDLVEMFSETETGDLHISIAGFADLGTPVPGASPVDMVHVAVPRGSNTVRLLDLANDRGTRFRGRRVVPRDPNSIAFEGEPDIRLDLTSLTTLWARLGQAVYLPAFRNIVNTGTQENYFDLQIGQAFVNRWRAIKTGPSRRENVAAIEVAKEIQSIFGFMDFDIDASDDGTTLKVRINGRPYKLNEVGAGIAQFILILTNLLVRAPVSLVLIDEPELNLHPRLQTQLMALLAERAEWGTIFSTHNLGLARTEADRIYSFVLESPGVTRVRPYEGTPRLAELVGELSFAGYQEIGFKALLLVEGRTDIALFREFLKHFEIESQVLVASLGGSDMIGGYAEPELLELTRITPNIWTVIDSEKDSGNAPLAASRASFVEACQRANVECLVLSRRASDNYLSEDAIRRTKGEKYRALGPFEKLESVQPAWGKPEGGRIARAMTRDDLADTDVGEFLGRLAQSLRG